MTAWPVAILDRDGTIIDVVRDEETGAIAVAFHPTQLRLLSGAVEGMRALQDAGFVLAIATNQPAPAKGQFSADAVRRTNDALVALLARRRASDRGARGVHAPPDGRRRGRPVARRRLRLPQAQAGDAQHDPVRRLDADPRARRG